MAEARRSGLLERLWAYARRTFAKRRPGLTDKGDPSYGHVAHGDAKQTTETPAAHAVAQGKVGDQRSLIEQKEQVVEADERDIVIGLDFGTSCTKAVIGDDVLQAGYAVPFGDFAHDGHPYLLPGRIFLGRDGRMDLSVGEFRVVGLKVKLLADPNRRIRLGSDSQLSPTALELCVGYLALALREIRAWFSNEYSGMYRNTKLYWQLNLGIPSASYDDVAYEGTFRLLGLAAYQAAVDEDAIDVDTVTRTIARCREDMARFARGESQSADDDEGNLLPDDVAAIPEVIAEVVGYARSDLRREGTHMLIDVGASTLDVATFVLHSNAGGDNFSLLVTKVQSLGAFELHRRRILQLPNEIRARLTGLLDTSDGVSPPPDLKTHPLVGAAHAEAIVRTDEEFRAECARLIADVIRETRQMRNPLSYVWQEGLPLLLCGGGASIAAYVEAVDRIEEHGPRHGGFDRLDLAIPANLTALTRSEYARLAVAYGLSFRADRIGKVTPPRDIPDIDSRREAFDYRDRYVGKEQV